MNISISTEQQVRLHVAFLTAAGNPAPVDGTPTWSSSAPSVVDLVVDSDGLGALAISKAVGTTLITVQADADTGSGTNLITGTLGLEVTPAAAEVVDVTADTPTFKPVVITVSVAMQPDGSALVTGTGAPNTLYHILAADAVTGPYAEIGTALSNSTGAFSYTDTDAPAHPTRFYRAVWP
jgi:hypothetical protein